MLLFLACSTLIVNWTAAPHGSGQLTAFAYHLKLWLCNNTSAGFWVVYIIIGIWSLNYVTKWSNLLNPSNYSTSLSSKKGKQLLSTGLLLVWTGVVNEFYLNINILIFVECHHLDWGSLIIISFVWWNKVDTEWKPVTFSWAICQFISGNCDRQKQTSIFFQELCLLKSKHICICYNNTKFKLMCT